MTEPARALRLLLLVLALLLHRPEAVEAQDGTRVGIFIGGSALIGLVVERIDGRRGIELAVGTWSFRDVSVSAAAKAYLGPSAMRPVLGAGFWATVAAPRDMDRTGAAVLARFPVGFDWRAAPGHWVGMEFNLSRALWIRRGDPDDERPPSRRLVPLPGASYRWMP